jgi:hypothetical protein
MARSRQLRVLGQSRAPTFFGAVRTTANRLSHLADLDQYLSFGRNCAADFALPVCRDRNVAPGPSGTLVTKAGPISDKPPLIDKKSLFDAAPFLKPLCGSRAGFEACQLNEREKSTAKES